MEKRPSLPEGTGKNCGGDAPMSMNTDLLTKPLKVLKRIQETPEAVSLVLEIPEALKKQFTYTAGQFVTFFLNVNGERLNRSYSLSSSPLMDTEFKVTVKMVTNGRGSTFLCQNVNEGDVLATTPPAGQFFKPSLEPRGTHYYLFAAGSGITPIFSIMKTVLKASSMNHVTLVFCNRNEESIIYRKEIDQWSKDFSGRLNVIHTLTNPSAKWSGQRGRISHALINEVLNMPAHGPNARECYLCGPTEFMQTVKTSLIGNGIDKDLIRIEDFGTELHKPSAPSPGVKVESDWTLIGPADFNESPEKIICELNGETTEIAAKAGQNILETLLEAGLQPPYSCMDGACMACMGKIVEGRVYQEDPGILMEDNIKKCESLTCQAKPLSRIVKVSYDNL
jgi:ring-1,2-phenylacetyl-CoA epoxidase subunit PaaE